MVMNALDEIDGWLFAIDAVLVLSHKLGGHEQAKADLLSRIQDGVLDCRAQYICQEADMGNIALDDLDWDEYHKAKPYKNQVDQTFLRPRNNEEKFEHVPEDFFLRSDGWTIDPKRCHWDRNFVVATRPALLRKAGCQADAVNGPLIRRFVFGLELPKNVIENMAGCKTTAIVKSPSDATLTGSRKQSNAGRPRSDSWNDWIAEVVVYLHEQGFDQQITARGFYDAVGDRMLRGGQTCPEFDTVEKAIGAIRRKMIDVVRSPDR